MIWQDDVYDIFSEGSGVCYTYNPPSSSQPGVENKFLAYLGNRGEAVEEGYYVYLHEKGQFWPIANLEMIGQSERIRINPGQAIGGDFKVKEKRYIYKKSRPCNEDSSYSFIQCLKEFIQESVGCEIWIWDDDTNVKYPSCTNITDFMAYKNIMRWISASKLSDLIEKTKCFPKCKIREFIFTKNSEEKISLVANWHAEFQLGVKLSSYEDFEEYFVFGFQDFITSVGSFLGLFLGWSLLAIIDWIQVTACALFHYCRQKIRK